MTRQQQAFDIVLAAKDRENQTKKQQHLDDLKKERDLVSAQHEQQQSLERAVLQKQIEKLETAAADQAAPLQMEVSYGSMARFGVHHSGIYRNILWRMESQTPLLSRGFTYVLILEADIFPNPICENAMGRSMY